MAGEFTDKSAARQWVCDRLRAEGVASFSVSAARPDPAALVAPPDSVVRGGFLNGAALQPRSVVGRQLLG